MLDCEPNQTGENDEFLLSNEKKAILSGTFCNVTPSLVYQALNNCPYSEYMTVRFKTDGQLTSSGFLPNLKLLLKSVSVQQRKTLMASLLVKL